MLIKSMNFYKFYYHADVTASVQMLEKYDSPNSKNEWLLLSTSLTAKFELVFVLILENAYF